MPSLFIHDDLALWTNEKFVLLVRFTYATITHVKFCSYHDDLGSAPLLLNLRIYWDLCKTNLALVNIYDQNKIYNKIFLNPIFMVTGISVPVSYTHLDVYKRQFLCCHKTPSMKGLVSRHKNFH